MAKVKLDWDHVEFDAKGVTGWVAFKKAVQLDNHQKLLSRRAVYVIRVMRPFAFKYRKGHSPVAYIGKGHAQQRVTSHLSSWIPSLAKTFPDLRIQIYFCEPRVRRSGTICEHVEADLLRRFRKRYGGRPLRNRVSPRNWGNHIYKVGDIEKALRPGKGKGYHWAIQPLPSSSFYQA